MSEKVFLGEPDTFYVCTFNGIDDTGCTLFEASEECPNECKHRDLNCDFCQAPNQPNIVEELKTLQANYDLAIKELQAERLEVSRLKKDYALFEELSPPDMPKEVFARWCFEAFDDRYELEMKLQEQNIKIAELEERLKSGNNK